MTIDCPNRNPNDSSIELNDCKYDETLAWNVAGNRTPDTATAAANKNNLPPDDSMIQIEIGDFDAPHESLSARLCRYFNERTICRRVIEFERRELKTFNAKLLHKMERICADEKTKSILIQMMMCDKNQQFLEDTYDVLKRKYGANMAECLTQHARFCTTLAKRHRLASIASAGMLDATAATSRNADETLQLRVIDPLSNWYRQPSDVSGRMLARVQNLASSACAKVKWSLLIEPGRALTDFSSFYAEFDVLEGFFDNVELSSEELSQKAFDTNATTKARNRKLECVDCSRVKLTAPDELTKGGRAAELALRRPNQLVDIFGDYDCPQVDSHDDSVFDDFIHANYVEGGPLMNRFILTQAPMFYTTADFWQMVWQEKSEYIFMLCGAVDTSALGLMSTSTPDCCLYYWPRYEGQSMRFGRLVVRNEGLDATVDPLFNVTHLAIWMDDDSAARRKIQHWQWDWRNFTDFHWPLRLLLRSRHSAFPTIVHCMDGCGLSGTLVLIEIFLMQLLCGTTSYDNTMLTSAVFLRLQRRKAVANTMQYLFAYRTVLHWAEPFIVSRYHRLVLGYLFKNSGFAAKYDQLAASYSSKRKI